MIFLRLLKTSNNHQINTSNIWLKGNKFNLSGMISGTQRPKVFYWGYLYTILDPPLVLILSIISIRHMGLQD